MNLKELKLRLDALGLDVKAGTLKRWAYGGLIPRPIRYKKGKGGGKGRAVNWPEESVEEAAAVYVLRHSDTAWAKPTNKAIIETKKVVAAFYRLADEFIRTGDRNILRQFDNLSVPVDTPDGEHGMMLGGYELQPLIVTWIVTLEKIRHDRPLFEPAKVTFNWYHEVAPEGDLKVVYKGVTLEPSDSNSLSQHLGTTEAAKKLREQFTETTINSTTGWGNVSFNVESQQIIIFDAKKKERVVLDLKGSSVQLVERGSENGSEDVHAA